MEQREIKFRVWTGIKMEYDVIVGILGAFYVRELDPKDSASLSPMNTLYAPNTPVMQYTGLKDKNGKEIYEGDIVSVDERKIIGKPSPQQAFNGYVKYSIQAAQWWIMSIHGKKERYNELAVGGQYGDENGIQLTSIEIIGNIYETPNLLNKQ